MRNALLTILLLHPIFLAAADTTPDPAKVQVAMEQMSRTGAEHTTLAKDVGEWDVQASTWMSPGTPPAKSKATATFTVVIDGKWVRQDFKGEMMGKSYMGCGLSGFDTIEKQYVSSWVDNMSTAMQKMIGASDDGGRTITYTSSMPHCPMTGGPITMRSVFSHESEDKMVFTMYQTPQGMSEMKGMELVYTRKAR